MREENLELFSMRATLYVISETNLSNDARYSPEALLYICICSARAEIKISYER